MGPDKATQPYEMSYHQKGLIESCFEEFNYEQGISMLDQLRDPGVRPSPAHTRQLVYLALYPPPVAASEAERWMGKHPNGKKGKEKEKEADIYSFGIKSPSKAKRSNNSKDSEDKFVPPSAEAIDRAWRLLFAYVPTYPPELLLRALPCYPLRDSEVAHLPRKIDIKVPWSMSIGEEEMDSGVAKKAVILMEPKDCWGLLRPDLVVAQRKSPSAQDQSPSPSTDDEDTSPAPVLIGPHSWRLLEWLIQMFEKDQELVNTIHADRFSTFLLSQIKPPSSTHESRSNVDVILDIVFVCYKQTSQRLQDLGRRLITLLIDLTSSPDFLPTQLLTSTTTHLAQCTGDLTTLFLRDLPPSDRGIAFKIAVCNRYLSTMNGRARADLRGTARPQARKARAQQEGDGEPTPHAISGSMSVRPRYPWAIPRTTHVLEAVEAASKEPSVSCASLLVLYELITAFSAFKHCERESTGEVDVDWKDALQGDRLRQSVLNTFSTDRYGGVEGRKLSVLKDILLNTLYIDKNKYL